MRLGVLTLSLAAAALMGCGGADGAPGASADQRGPLRWEGEPTRVDGTKTLPDDRIVLGRIRNDSLRKLSLRANDLKLEAADGTVIRGNSLAFIDHFAHGIFPPTRREELASKGEREAEDRRLGRVVEIEPGKTAPLTFAWRQGGGAPVPVRVVYPEGFLAIPASPGN